MHSGTRVLVGTLALLVLMPGAELLDARSSPQAIAIDFPVEGTLYPPDFPAPTFQWREGDHVYLLVD